jgi:two-component system response regulator (stage 0 sporulation protein F)
MENRNNNKEICTILTVDDELGIDSFFYEFFTLRNYRVLTAVNGKDAVRIAKKERPSIVLLDIKMKGMDGIEALRQIKEIDKKTIIIMVSGVKDDEMVKKALSLGADEYIAKPLSMEHLEKVVLLKFLSAQMKDIKDKADELMP